MCGGPLLLAGRCSGLPDDAQAALGGAKAVRPIGRSTLTPFLRRTAPAWAILCLLDASAGQAVPLGARGWWSTLSISPRPAG